MLDPDVAEDFLEEYSSGNLSSRDGWAPVDKVDLFFDKAENAVGRQNGRIGRFFSKFANLLTFNRRNRPAPPEESRKVVLNDPEANKRFRTNYVSTAKFNYWNALPKFLYEQFVLRLANVYFLFVGILYCIDSISPVLTSSRYGQLISVAFIITVSLIKEIVEDTRRHVEDRRINRLGTFALGSKGEISWAEVKVGDILRISKNDAVPADVVLLHSSSEDGLAFVETKQLDGESNLKVKATLPDISEQFSEPEGCLTAEGFVESEPPNPRLHHYYGSITLVGKNEDGGPAGGATTYPLNIDNLLVRGCRLKQTDYVYALVVNTGLDTKLMRNLKPKPKKVSSTESKVNFLLIFPICLQVFIVTTLTILNAVNCADTQSAWYLELSDSCTPLDKFLRFFTFFCTFANLIPISLYVSIEVIRGFQVYFITGDRKTIAFEHKPPVRLEVRTSSLTDELGILTHLFSDKTGTLTANDMVFRKCFVAGEIFQDANEPDSSNTDFKEMGSRLWEARDELPHLRDNVSREVTELIQLRDFNYLLSICHSVVRDDGLYQASSPDEGALVETARKVGFEFVQRSNKVITLNVLGKQEEWPLLGVLEFNSKRKRMTVIAQSPHTGRVVVFCKGADTVIFSRISPLENTLPTTEALDQLACEGLRTLCLAYREVSEGFFADWSRRWAEAQLDPNREEACEVLSNEIESDLTLLGCTGIEDRLQDEVPGTLKDLERANVKVWVLTGDKLETAINIGLTCGLLEDGMDVVVVNESTLEDAEAQLDKAFGRWSYLLRDGKDSRHMGLVVDGGTLEYVLKSPEAERKLVLLGKVAKTVIGCRVSPKQKADIVEMVRRHDPKAITAAVGDGANDVAMIQAAHVGIGIVGVEGLEAKLVSDFSVGQFRFLRRLILVHGRWCYKRLSKVICYIMYKNLLLVTNEFYYAFFNAFSGQPLFDPWVTAAYNVLVTSIPIVIIGAYDADVAARYALEFPEVYRRTQQRTALRNTVFLKWVLSGVWQGTVVFWFTQVVFGETLIHGDGKVGGLYSFGVLVFTQVVLVAHGVLFVYQSSWNSLLIFVAALSLSMWFWIGPVYSSQLLAFDLGMTRNLLGVVPFAWSQGTVWLLFFATTIFCVVPGYTAKYVDRNYRPTGKNLVQELMRRGLTRKDILEEPEDDWQKGHQLPHFSRRDMEMQMTSYAFDALKDTVDKDYGSRGLGAANFAVQVENERRKSDSYLDAEREMYIDGDYGMDAGMPLTSKEGRRGHRRVHTDNSWGHNISDEEIWES